LAALVLRTVSLTTFGIQVDEQITKDVITGIWNGQWSNNWKYTVTAPEFRIDQYNFSSYLYADALIAGAQSQFPGLVFTPVGPVDAHHRQARFRWALGPEGGESLVEGFDVAVLDDQNKITIVLGFLDKVPS